MTPLHERDISPEAIKGAKILMKSLTSFAVQCAMAHLLEDAGEPQKRVDAMLAFFNDPPVSTVLTLIERLENQPIYK